MASQWITLVLNALGDMRKVAALTTDAPLVTGAQAFERGPLLKRAITALDNAEQALKRPHVLGAPGSLIQVIQHLAQEYRYVHAFARAHRLEQSTVVPDAHQDWLIEGHDAVRYELACVFAHATSAISGSDSAAHDAETQRILSRLIAKTSRWACQPFLAELASSVLAWTAARSSWQRHADPGDTHDRSLIVDEGIADTHIVAQCTEASRVDARVRSAMEMRVAAFFVLQNLARLDCETLRAAFDATDRWEVLINELHELPRLPEMPVTTRAQMLRFSKRVLDYVALATPAALEALNRLRPQFVDLERAYWACVREVVEHERTELIHGRLLSHEDTQELRDLTVLLERIAVAVNRPALRPTGLSFARARTCVKLLCALFAGPAGDEYVAGQCHEHMRHRVEFTDALIAISHHAYAAVMHAQQLHLEHGREAGDAVAGVQAGIAALDEVVQGNEISLRWSADDKAMLVPLHWRETLCARAMQLSRHAQHLLPIARSIVGRSSPALGRGRQPREDEWPAFEAWLRVQRQPVPTRTSPLSCGDMLELMGMRVRTQYQAIVRRPARQS